MNNEMTNKLTNGLYFDPGYNDWQLKRIAFILKTKGNDFFSGKKILELGCFQGGISKILNNLVKDTGGTVTSVEGSIVNYNKCKEDYPDLDFINYDLDPENDSEWPFDSHYDIIVHWGLLYHLRYPENSINSCLQHCDTLLLETIIMDTYDDENSHVPEHNLAHYPDQSIHSIGSRFNAEFVESTFKHLKFKRYDSAELNSKYHPPYDWKPTNDGNMYRRFWIVENEKINE